MSKPKTETTKKTIRVRKTDCGDYVAVSGYGLDETCTIYMGEDAKILDKLFGHDKGEDHDN